MELKIGNKYRIHRKIGENTYYNSYLGYSPTNEEVNIIIEPLSKDSKLQYESRIYRILQEGTGIPKLIWSGVDNDYNVLILELLGPSLQTLLNYCKSPFSLKTVLILADQMISRIEFMHSYSYLHRDTKPENFSIGIGKKANTIYLNSFGLAKKYVEKYNHHIAYKEGKKFIGTARYASINKHYGIEQSRRDDLESLGYLMIFLLQGKLPWQGLPGATKEEKYRNIMVKKVKTPLEEICCAVPSEFHVYINYCRTLRFEEKPDYSYLRRIFKELFQRENYQNDSVFDWYLPRNKRGKK